MPLDILNDAIELENQCIKEISLLKMITIALSLSLVYRHYHFIHLTKLNLGLCVNDTNLNSPVQMQCHGIHLRVESASCLTTSSISQ